MTGDLSYSVFKLNQNERSEINSSELGFELRYKI